ncbi:MAG: ABC transporter permease [Verrucomicrobiae bacterium]|jgi:putative ABC transport system permease protein|nr:ABC transporter permease [Verrucomicrobiae bacterium]
MFRFIRQAFEITRLSLATLGQRKGSSFASVFGIAGVVAVFVGVLSIGQGFRNAMTIAGSPRNAVVLRSGADSEMMSGVSREESRIISEAPGIARGGNGPLSSAELFVVINLPKRSTGTDANVPLRGVGQEAFDVRDDIEIVKGRRFETGRNEVIVGRAAALEFAGLELGGKVEVGKNEWTVVGIFTQRGGIAESEMWTDASVLQSAYRRGDTFQAVYARLTGQEAFNEFKDALTTDPRLNVKVIRQTDFYSEQSTAIYNLIVGLGAIIAILMAVGAVFGALNTMFSAVATRTREIATLRALGFNGLPVVVSILLESVVLALVGGGLGGGLAWWAFDGYQASTINWQTFSQVAFAFDVTPSLLAQGIFYATVIGMVGGLFPAIRAARMPVATALREI